MKTEKEELLFGLTEKEVIEIGDNISDYKRGFADATVKQINIMKKDRTQIKQNILDDIEDNLIDKLKDKFCTCGYKVFISPIDTRCESCKFIDSFYERLKQIIKSEFGELEDEKF